MPIMAIYSISLTYEEKEILSEYSAAVNKSIDEILLESFFDRLEKEYDIKTADEAYGVFLKNPRTLPLDDVMKEHGL